ncbi:Mitochondrial import inner membrane translocase subunit tim8 [Coemansia sp. IMI 209127]|nr:Mitochondrial import inner membrane translocase subunit tim8 [Coemansia sp. IMI 209127]
MALGIDEATTQDLVKFVEQETEKAKIQSTVHELTNRCWETCIKYTNANSLDRSETACLENCVGRFLDSTAHVIKRLQSSQM